MKNSESDPAIIAAKITPEKKLFHNVWIDVYPKKLQFNQISYWPENHRTVLAFDLLEVEKKKKLADITLAEITQFIAEQPKLKIENLADSIKTAGVRIPLIVLDNGVLLDGNRRFFACSYLHFQAKNKGLPDPDVLNKIPVWEIKASDLKEVDRFKILAEANYVPSHKIEWSLDVKAQVVSEFYKNCIKIRKLTPEKAYEEIKDVFGEDKSSVDAYVESTMLADEFVESAPSEKTNEYRGHVQGKFLYFWEFRNKALRGRAPLDVNNELPKVKKLFFKMVATGCFDNFKQVEPMIRSVRDEYSWELLSSSLGTKIDQVEALYKEQRAVRSAEDKIRNFLKWLQGHKEQTSLSSLSKSAIKYLQELVSEINDLLKKL